MAKAIILLKLTLKYEGMVKKRIGLDTLVVHTANDEYYELGIMYSVTKANALNIPPGDYDRKIETQEDWREHLRAVEHAC